MPIVSVPTSFNISLEFDAPGLGRRWVALLIDMVVQVLYVILASYLLSKISIGFDSDAGFNQWAIGLLVMSPIFLYHILFESLTNGQSIGKKIMSLRVVSINGGRPSISQLLIRWLLRVSDLWIVILLVMLLTFRGGGDTEGMIAFTFGMAFLLTDIILVANSKKAQRIGDILAQTIVIKTSAKESLHNTIFREVEDGYIPAFPQVMRISDKDLNIIKNLLGNTKNSRHHDELAIAATKVKNYLQIETDMYPYEFLERLLKDYNYLSVK